MIKMAIEVEADAIGMSGLLVKSTNIMRDNIDEINRQGIKKKILLGGAALTEKFVSNDCMPLMPGMVSYCRDAFDALKVLSGETNGSTRSGNSSCGSVHRRESDERFHHRRYT